MVSEKKIIKIGTRGSRLALIQTDMVIDALTCAFPDYRFEKIEITTKGDKERIRPIYEFGGKAVFVEDIEAAISDGVIDMAVHSAKDMPNPCGKGLGIAGVLEREDPRDVLIYRKATVIDKDKQFVVGTSSQRREYQIKKLYPHVICSNLRGNIGTRIEKLRNGKYDAIILAKAGIKRQGLDNEGDMIYQELEIDDMIPAAGQGIIAIEALEESDAYKMAEKISDEKAFFSLMLERKVLSRVGASCHEPVGVYVTDNLGIVTIELMRVLDGHLCRKKVVGDKTRVENLIEKICEI